MPENIISPQILIMLRSFDTNEIERFNDFVYSPFHNKSGTIKKFWEELKKYSPDFRNEFMTKEFLFKKVFGGKKYNYGTMKNLIHTFLNLLEEYLEIEFHLQDKFQFRYNTLVYSIVKYYPELFKKRSEMIRKEFSDIKEGADNHYVFKYQLLKLSSSFNSLESNISNILFEQGDALVHLFLIQLFQIHYNIKVFYNSKNIKQKNNLAEEILKILDLEKMLEKVKLNSPKDFKVVDLYYHLFLSTNDPGNNKIFYEFIKRFLDSRKFLHKYEFEGIANTVINTFTNRSYLGIEGTAKETDEFVKKLITLKVEFGVTDFKISIVHFSKNLKSFFEAGDIEYVEKFYEKYKKKLLEKDRLPMENYYIANTYYVKNDFNKALEYANKIRSEVEQFKIFMKEFQLKCYYELNEPIQFNYTLKAYRLMVYRKGSLNESRKEYTKNFLNTLNSLFEYKVYGKQKLIDIKMEIDRNKMINKEWILQKLSEIKKKK